MNRLHNTVITGDLRDYVYITVENDLSTKFGQEIKQFMIMFVKRFLYYFSKVWKQSLCDAWTHGHSHRRTRTHSIRNVENRSNPHGKFVRSWSHYKCQVQGRNQSGLQVAKVLKDVSIYNYLQYYLSWRLWPCVVGMISPQQMIIFFFRRWDLVKKINLMILLQSNICTETNSGFDRCSSWFIIVCSL